MSKAQLIAAIMKKSALNASCVACTLCAVKN